LQGTGGDLLAADGRIVKTFSNLVEALGLSTATMPGIDALDIGPGGEIFFPSAKIKAAPTSVPSTTVTLFPTAVASWRAIKR
jgi:hypothetical protein